MNRRQENIMNPTRIALVSLVVTVAATSTIAAVTKLSDKFTASSLGALWTSYADGETTLVPSGGVLNANADGSGNAIVLIEDYQLTGGSWKASVVARQTLASSAIDGQSAFHAFLGLQYGPVVDGENLEEQSNGYLIGVDIYADSAYVGWSERGGGAGVDGDSIDATSSRLLAGNIVATYTAKKDRLVVQAGRYKQTFSAFVGLSAFDGNANGYLGAQAEGDVSGKMFTFDNFALSGAGVASVP
jgi:hypothetical protein